MSIYRHQIYRIKNHLYVQEHGDNSVCNLITRPIVAVPTVLVLAIFALSLFVVPVAASSGSSQSIVQGGISGGPAGSGAKICGDSSCTYTVSNSNVPGCPGVTMTIKVDTTGATTVATVTLNKGSSGCTAENILSFGFNISPAPSGLSVTKASCGKASNWVVSSGSESGNAFNTVITNNNGNTPQCTKVTLTFNQLFTTFTPTKGHYFVANVEYQSGNTGYIGTPVFPFGMILAILAPLGAFGAFLYIRSRKSTGTPQPTTIGLP
jgi:hypothetical protein